LLSFLLKPFLQKRTNDKRVLHPDTELSLSMIDSGCLFVRIDDKPALIIKDAADEIQMMKEFQVITIDFELIERPEFPSLAFNLHIDTKKNKSFRFEYFFSTESVGEMETLKKMCNDRRFDILLYSSGVELMIQAEISAEQAAGLKSLLIEAGS